MFVVWVVGFLGFVLLFLVFLPPPTCSVSILSMMTWTHRPHGVRARGKKGQVDGSSTAFYNDKLARVLNGACRAALDAR